MIFNASISGAAGILTRRVGIVILNYRNYEDTIECLRSLSRITYRDKEIVVVDNDSQDDSLENIHQDLSSREVAHVVIAESGIDTSDRISEKTVLVQSISNRGYAAGNNLGIQVALAKGADYILILNNDTLVEESFLEPLVHYAETHGHVGAVGPKVLNTAGQIDRACARRRPTPLGYFFLSGIGRRLFSNNRWVRRHTYTGEYCFDRPREVDVLSGCCMLLKRSVFATIGLLDENTFLYFEEFILHERLRGAGLSSAVVPSSVIVHKHGRSTAKAPSDFTRHAVMASFRYYLTHYRHYGRFTATAIMLSTGSPKTYLRGLWNAR